MFLSITNNYSKEVCQCLGSKYYYARKAKTKLLVIKTRDYGQFFNKRNHFKCYLSALNCGDFIYIGHSTDRRCDRIAHPISTEGL